MKIILLGKNGQLGQELLKLFSPKDEIYSYSRSELDVTNLKAIRKIISKIKPDIVINTTVIHATLDGERNPGKLFDVNAIAVMNLSKVCLESNARLITYSSDYVFDGKKGKPYAEDDLQCPNQQFGISKYMGEILAINYDPNTIIIRTCGLYGGLKGSRLKGNFVLNMLKDASNKKMVEVSGEQIVNPTYSVDLAVASMKLINKNPKGGIYHLASSGYGSWAEFTKRIIDLSGLKIKVKSVNRNGVSGGIRRPLFSALANKKAKKIGITLPSWENALTRYINFLTDN